MLMKNQTLLKLSLALVIYTTLFISCTNETKKPDVSAVPVEISVDRFEKDLFGLDVNHPAESISKLKAKYGSFFDLFMFQVTRLGAPDSLVMQERILSFVQDTNFRAVYEDCEKTFGDFSSQKEELNKSFQYYKYYFPNKQIPRVVTLLSAFSFPIVCDSFNLGISLDMYLGSKNHFYSTLQPPLPNYLRMQMIKENVVCDAMKGWAMSDYSIDESSAKVMDMMISQGKIIAFLEKVVPDAPDSMRMGFTQAQMDWCESNEAKMWQFFISNNLLFSVDPKILMKYTSEGPTTNGFPKESPGNIGKYLGWRIVKSYLKKHPEITLQQLMDQKDLMTIYSGAGYKPRGK